jgi:hypothetical protein
MTSTYYVQLITLAVVIDGPGEYLTRCGDRVTIATTSTGHDLGNRGSYAECGTRESWHRSGRISASRETSNDIVRRA